MKNYFEKLLYSFPINVSLGTFENQVLPLVVLEHFLKKASHIVLTECGCRRENKCKNHDYKLGCTWVVQAAGRIDLESGSRHVLGGHHATAEEALERARKAYESGLFPHLGRLRPDSMDLGVLPDDGRFMSLCYCCSCCCILSTIKHSTSVIKKIMKRMEGV